MDASKKQREPVAFKSLAELKRFIRPGVELKTVSHANHADMVGLTRVVTTVQTVGFYSKIKDQPEHPFSTCNHGKGFYTDFGKAGNYIFDGTTVKVKDARKQDRGVIYELEFYDREQNMEETMMDRKMVNFIKEQYPPGTRIRLNAMDDPHHPILPGTEGEVDFVDDEGQIFVKWDNGRTLPLIPGEDSFTVLPPKLTTLKLYMPLTADLYERNEYGDFDDSSTLLEGRELRGYRDQITAALVKNRMPEETERGLMHWYDEADSVDRKVRSAVFTVEKRDRQLWGVAECRVTGELSVTELEMIELRHRINCVGWPCASAVINKERSLTARPGKHAGVQEHGTPDIVMFVIPGRPEWLRRKKNCGREYRPSASPLVPCTPQQYRRTMRVTVSISFSLFKF